MGKATVPVRKQKATRTASSKTSAAKAKSKQASPATETNLAELPPDLVTVDRRRGKDRRSGEDRRKVQVPVAVERRQGQRRKVQRRRMIDPTTCERDYTPEEIEFMVALDNYKRASGRMFPTCSEILEVLRSLGYRKCTCGQGEQKSTSAVPGSASQDALTAPASATATSESAGPAAGIVAAKPGESADLPADTNNQTQ